MNIFVLDTCPKLSAIYQPDKMLVKMVLETAQLLSTTHRFLDGDKGNEELYKSTHVNHPCSKWVRKSVGNYFWLSQHFLNLGKEYKHRFKREHKSFSKLKKSLITEWPKNIPIYEKTPFAQAMPEQYRDPSDAVKAYRNYVIAEKSYAKWENGREKPDWWK
jgi:hypothetical protein